MAKKIHFLFLLFLIFIIRELLKTAEISKIANFRAILKSPEIEHVENLKKWKIIIFSESEEWTLVQKQYYKIVEFAQKLDFEIDVISPPKNKEIFG